MSSGPTNPELPPIGDELAARRGWHPPPPSRGLAFVAGLVVVLTIAIVGAVGLITPSFRQTETSSAVSSTTLTSGEALMEPSATAWIDPSATAADDAPARANDAKGANDATDAKGEKGEKGAKDDEAKDAKSDEVKAASSSRSRAAVESKPSSRASAKARPAGPKAKAKPKAKREPKPELKRDARPAPEPTEDDLFSTPGTDVPPAPAVQR